MYSTFCTVFNKHVVREVYLILFEFDKVYDIFIWKKKKTHNFQHLIQIF